MRRSVYTVRFIFRDNDGNEASIHLYVPVALSTEQVVSFLNVAGPKLQNLSNASLVSAKVFYNYTFDSPQPAQLGSDCTSYAVLFYRNEDIYDAIYIPSPEASLFESEGEYSGIRVDAYAPAVVSFNAALLSLPWTLATEEQDPFPLEYVVGGRVL